MAGGQVESRRTNSFLIPSRPTLLRLLGIGFGLLAGLLCAVLALHLPQILGLDALENFQNAWKRQIGRAYTADALLGYKPLPGARALLLYKATGFTPILTSRSHPTEMRVEYCNDERGLRVPAKAVPSPPQRPLILTLGCSYTYGEGCPAEKTFTFRLQELLGAQTLNGGVCGYGLAPMVLRGKALIKEYKPDIVIAQYSPWLVERSEQPLTGAGITSLSTPYFAAIGPAKRMAIIPSSYQSLIYGFPLERFFDSTNDLRTKLHYAWQVGLPLLLHDSYYEALLKSEIALGLKPAPVVEWKRIMVYAYSDLLQACREAHAQLYVLLLEPGNHRAKAVEIFKNLGIPVIDADRALKSGLRRETDYFEVYSAFRLWTKEGKLFSDSHPNALAHAIIAKEIGRVIKPGLYRNFKH